MATASSPFHFLFPAYDQTRAPFLFNRNDEELQVQLLLDAAFAEELQFQEALKASFFTCQLPSNSSLHVEVKGESSLGFCEICMKRKPNDQLIKNGEQCVHSFCLDCISKHLEEKIKVGMTTVACPSPNCECVLKLNMFKHLLSEEVVSLWEQSLIPDVTCSSEELQVETSSGLGERNPFTESGSNVSKNLSLLEMKTDIANSAQHGSKRTILEKKQERPAARNIPEDLPRKVQSALNYGQNSHSRSSLTRGKEQLESVRSCFKNISSLSPASISCTNGQEDVADVVKKNTPAFAAAAAAANDDGNDDTDSDASPYTDDYDSEGSPRSSDICKKSKWFKKFVEALQYLGIEEIKDTARQWHCPACQGGAGAIKRYLGVQTLIQHTKTKGSRRVRLHRELAQLLEEKLHSNEATSATSAEEPHIIWKGLKEEKKDHEIVWPPMVVITNVIHKKDENNKLIGITSQELLDLFSSYDAIVKAQHSYGWKGHSGMSMLIFESSAKGYLEAERLHKHFIEEGIDRNAWNNQRVYFLPDRERQLYGYLANKEDLDIFNKISSKPQLKYEMRSYQEMVVNRIRQLSEDNHQLLWLKNRVAVQERQAKDLEESNHMLKEKLQKATKELDILRRKANEQHEQSLQELGSLEQFYKDQIRNILEAREGKDEDLENTKLITQENANAASIVRKRALERKLLQTKQALGGKLPKFLKHLKYLADSYINLNDRKKEVFPEFLEELERLADSYINLMDR